MLKDKTNKNKEDISKAAAILEERVFGKDLKNVNPKVKNITFRQDKNAHGKEAKVFSNYNLLKPKEDTVTINI
jgi:hypothetical protein